MNNMLETLTDFEEAGLRSHFCLADGHAYQDLHPAFHGIIDSLPQIWSDSAQRSIPDAERLFNKSYASFIGAPILEKSSTNFKICPTASNSIDIVGAVLNHLKHKAIMVEPTFDNLALLLRRRGVHLDSVQDVSLFRAAEANEIESVLPELKNYDALVLVHPNNPTGLTLSENAFRNVVGFCKKHDIVLVIDNCFRVYRKNIFCDYSILIESSVSFMTLEDTGKVWPTQDMKASLMYFSDDLKKIFHEIYNEIYLCVSNFSLGILSAFFDVTAKVGVQKTIWDIVESRRLSVRRAIEGSKLSVNPISINSNLPVEWLTYSGTDKDDFLICHELKQLNLAILPGRQFYWNSANLIQNQRNVRVSLMKREEVFSTGLNILSKYANKLNKDISQINEMPFSIAV